MSSPHTFSSSMRRGKVLNRASRMASKALGGLVLASAAAWSRARKHPAVSEHGIAADMLGEFELKGVAGPMTLVSCHMEQQVAAVRAPAVQAVPVAAAASGPWEVMFPKPLRGGAVGLLGSARAQIDPGSGKGLVASAAEAEAAEGPQQPLALHGPPHRLMQTAPLCPSVSTDHMPDAFDELASPSHGTSTAPLFTLFTLTSEQVMMGIHAMDGSGGGVMPSSEDIEVPEGLTGFPLSDESLTALSSGTWKAVSASWPVLSSSKDPPEPSPTAAGLPLQPESPPTAAGPSPQAVRPPSPSPRLSVSIGSSLPPPSQPSVSQSTTRNSPHGLPSLSSAPNLLNSGVRYSPPTPIHTSGKPSLSSTPNLLNSGIRYSPPTPLHMALANARVASRERPGMALYSSISSPPHIMPAVTPAVAAAAVATPTIPAPASYSHLRPRLQPHHQGQGGSRNALLLTSAPYGASWSLQLQQAGMGGASDSSGRSSPMPPPHGEAHSERLVWRASDI